MMGAQVMRHSAPPLHVHAPPVHPLAVSLSHARPQAPQLLTLLLVFVHTPEQHDSAPEQVRPHAPQLATVSSRAQRPPQQKSAAVQGAPPQRQVPITHVSPGRQEGMQVAALQVPDTQLSPAAHRRPQVPQLLTLLLVSTQPPPQQDCGSAQAVLAPQRHVPLMHVSPGSHAGMHIAPPQEPPLQVVPMSQRLPQRPQWLELLVVSTQVPPQHSWVPVHAGMQVAPVSSPMGASAPGGTSKPGGTSRRPASIPPPPVSPLPPEAHPGARSKSTRAVEIAKRAAVMTPRKRRVKYERNETRERRRARPLERTHGGRTGPRHP
jgi:hypothetical protein